MELIYTIRTFANHFWHSKILKLNTFVILCFSLLHTVSFSQTNLLVNGDFENGLTGWAERGGTMSLSTDAYSGLSSGKCSNRTDSWNSISQDLTSVLKSGENYNLSAWIKCAAPSKNLRATLELNVNGVSTYIGYFWTSSPATGLFVYYEETISPKWSGTLNKAILYFETEKDGLAFSDYYLDDVRLELLVPDTTAVKPGKGLKDIKCTMKIGGLVGDLSKPIAKNQFLSDCNATTVTCYPAWGRWDESKKYVYHLDEFNGMVQELKKTNLNVTAHMLLGWDQYFPDWFRLGDFDSTTLDSITKTWIKSIITYNGNDTLVDIWNIVNEAISWDGKGGYWPINASDNKMQCELQRIGYEDDASVLTGAMKVNAKHPVYIRKAFEYARQFTTKKLELRESGFEFPTDAKYKAFYQLAAHLKKVGAPIDVIGFQTHLDLDKPYDWEGYANNIKRFRELGYEVNIPEVDIGDTEKKWSDEKAKRQKTAYYNLVTAAIRGGASEFQTWGFIDDNSSWRDGEKAWPFTRNYVKKPAYFGMQEALIDMSHILFWEMNANEGAIMPDVMKYNNFGTLNGFGTPAFVNGFKSKALQFDGVDDYISTGALSDSISGNFTFSCYVKTATNKAGIIADISGVSKSGAQIGISDNGKIVLFADGTGLSTDNISSKAINDNLWHFIALQRDSNIYKLFVDSDSAEISKIGVVQQYNKLNIGAGYKGISPFEGAIDEVKLYDWAIDSSSFLRNMNPMEPLKLTVSKAKMIMKLVWNDQSNCDEGFIVERKIGNGQWQEIAPVSQNILKTSDTVELYNTQYTYRVASYNKFGKSAYSNEVVVISPADPNTGILNQKTNTKCSMYPNPVTNSFTLTYKGNSDVKIVNLNGVLLREIKNANENQVIDISALMPGIYILKVKTKDEIQSIKLFKK